MGHCSGLCRGVAKVVGGDVRDKTSSLLLVPFGGFISLVSSDILRGSGGTSPHFHGKCLNMFFLIYATVYEYVYILWVYEGQLVDFQRQRAKARKSRPDFGHPESCVPLKFIRKQRETQQNSWFVHDASVKVCALVRESQENSP